MSTVRVHKDKGYFLASNAPFNDKRLSWEARGIMGYLLSKPDGWQCRSYDLINQTSAGKHVIKRVMNELQEAGYVHRFRKSEGRNTIKWITEVYETPDLNPYLSKAEKPAIEKDGIKGRFFDIESYDDEKPGDIVMTDSSNDLPPENTKKASSANADHIRPVSLLSLEKIKAEEMTITEWKQALEDEQAERNRKGVVKFIEGKILYWNLIPRNDEEKLLFEILKVEYDDDGGKAPPLKFPCRETKRLFNEAAEFHNGTLDNVIRKAIHKRGKGIKNIVDYINSPEWRKGQTNGQADTRTSDNRQAEVDGQASGETRADAYLRRNQSNIDAWEAKMFG